MNLDQIVTWYQKNITKYDKKKLEESAEQRFQNGSNQGHLTYTKLKPELIDVDLVRGSSFPKTKPKQTLYVLRLAVLRLIFLPFYSKWWIEQTSRNTFKVLLYLYVLQLFNWGIYILNIAYSERKHMVSSSDVVVPILLSLLLSMIHSQIVDTGGTSTNDDEKLEERVRKRKDDIRTRKLKRVSNNDTKIENESTPKTRFKDDPDSNNSNINEYSVTNCPIGLRKRNEEWNHVFSPFWIDNTNKKTQNVSYTDDGFESFIEKTSNSEDPTAVHHINVRSPIRIIREKKNLNSMPNDITDIDEDDLLSPYKNSRFIDDISSPLLESECSYSSESDQSESQIHKSTSVPIRSFPSSSSTITCTMFLKRETKKVKMTIFDILSIITDKVEVTSDSSDYIYVGILFSILLAIFPVVCRLYESALGSFGFADSNILDVIVLQTSFTDLIWETLVLTNGLVLRFSLTFLLFFLLTVAERTFKQRLLYAKIFSHLTSARRARKSEMPHFRLSKLRNIKMWLNVRSYLKGRGPQRSVDVIVSAAFILNLAFVSFLCAESLNDSVQQHWQYNLEALLWSCCLGCFILRFMTLGTEINDKYRNVSVLITEQINLYLKIEQNPEKKQELMMSSSVLKLATDLLKELESPFKISGVIANPYLSAFVRVVIVSALSGVGSEILGFKLKLFKTKDI